MSAFIKYILILCQIVVFITALSVVVFALARLAPGDPLTAYYGDTLDRMSAVQKANAMSRLALDQPLPVQYMAWLKNALQGDLGISHIYKQPVKVIIKEFWFNTLLLGGLSYVFTFALATFLGAFCARREGSITDTFICKIGTATSVIPTFFTALILILIFSVNLKILPTGGAYSIGGNKAFLDRVLHLILPVSTLVLSHLWYYAYIIRNKLIDELNRDYVLLLQIKRLSLSKILYCHCLKNSLPALITLMSVSIPHIIAGTYITEVVFNYSGLGRLIFEAARYKDYNMLSALTILTGLIAIIAGVIGQELSFKDRQDVRGRWNV